MPPCSSFIIPRPLVNEGRRHEKKSTSHRCTVIREAFHCVRRSNTCSPMTDLSDEMTHFLLEDWLRVLYLAAHKRPPFYIVIQYCRQSGMDIMEKLLPDFLKGRSFQRLSPCCNPPIHAHARHRLADSALSDPLKGATDDCVITKTSAFPPKRQCHSIPIHSLFSSIGSSSHSNFVLHHLKFKLFSRGPFCEA